NATTVPTATTYMIEPAHSAAHFKVRHMMIANVRGEFSKISGTVVFDSANPANSSVTADIDVNSINTREADRDTLLKGPDFFVAATYPTIKFRSKKVEPEGDGAYKVTGDLTIKGVTKPVTMQVEGPTGEAKDPWGYIRRGADAVTKINREDFGLTWNQALETGGVLVGKEIEISLEIEMARKA